jgi:PhzF family phenazine biosynthesis protein
MPFAGNPAAVCVISGTADEMWMRNVAREMNLSETAFLVRREDGFGLRWFTPAAEVDLCGHATLASAHVLWAEKHLPPGEEARFHTRSGLLTARQRDGWIELDFPATLASPAEPPVGLLEALGVAAVWVSRSRFDYLIEVASEDVVRTASPDFTALRRLEARGIIVTAPSATGDCDFVSRFFAPAVGVDEDPVTGSAHCALTPYWSERIGKTEMTARQLSARGGYLRVRLAGSRVLLQGKAVTVMTGDLLA